MILTPISSEVVLVPFLSPANPIALETPINISLAGAFPVVSTVKLPASSATGVSRVRLPLSWVTLSADGKLICTLPVGIGIVSSMAAWNRLILRSIVPSRIRSFTPIRLTSPDAESAHFAGVSGVCSMTTNPS